MEVVYDTGQVGQKLYVDIQLLSVLIVTEVLTSLQEGCPCILMPRKYTVLPLKQYLLQNSFLEHCSLILTEDYSLLGEVNMH